MSDGFKPQGALDDCFLSPPHFENDFKTLVREGYVEITGPGVMQMAEKQNEFGRILQMGLRRFRLCSLGVLVAGGKSLRDKTAQPEEARRRKRQPAQAPAIRGFHEVETCIATDEG